MGHRSVNTSQYMQDQQARARRWRGSRMERNDALRERVLSHLSQGWSPEQVAGRMAMESGKKSISHESIYRFVYGQLARTQDYSWRHYLPRGKSKRGWRGRKGGSPASFMAKRRSIAERPQSVADRRTPGHWEADLMLFKAYGHAVLTMHERYSRILIAVRPPGKASSPIAGVMSQLLGQFPPDWRRTVTFDNGTEFAPALPTPRAGYRDLLLRYPLSLAEGWRRECHRPASTHPAAQDRSGRPCPTSSSPG